MWISSVSVFWHVIYVHLIRYLQNTDIIFCRIISRVVRINRRMDKTNVSSHNRHTDAASKQTRKLLIATSNSGYYQFMPRKTKNCPFVYNQKEYLRRNGYNINDMYSIGRKQSTSRATNDQNKSAKSMRDFRKYSLTSMTNSPSNCMKETSPQKKKRTRQSLQKSVWKPEDSRRIHDGKDRSFAAFNKQIDKVLRVPDYDRGRNRRKSVATY